MGRSHGVAYDPSVTDYRATSPSEWGGFAYFFNASGFRTLIGFPSSQASTFLIVPE